MPAEEEDEYGADDRGEVLRSGHCFQYVHPQHVLEIGGKRVCIDRATHLGERFVCSCVHARSAIHFE